MNFIEKERRQLIKKCEWALKQNQIDIEESIQELEMIDSIYQDSVNSNNIEFVNSIAKDAIEYAKELIVDHEQLNKALSLLGVNTSVRIG